MSLLLVTLFAKSISFLSRFLHLGAGVTWPGELALRIDPTLPRKLSQQVRHGIILIAGTNGKTTTTKLIGQIITSAGLKVLYNTTGANLINGITGTMLVHTSLTGNLDYDYALFEVDEASLPQVVEMLTPQVVVLLNLFRDQLDRYGEVDTIAAKWKEALDKINQKQTSLVVNADDHAVCYIGMTYSGKRVYFGLNDQKLNRRDLSHATDSTYCLWCGHKLLFDQVYLSHYGNWHCPACGKKRPPVFYLDKITSQLEGTYNLYNIHASLLVANLLGFSQDTALAAISRFQPAFGRQEEFNVKGRKLKIYLSKNPAGFNESLITALAHKKTQTCLIVLNDRIPDGTDVSWIWDVDFEIINSQSLTIILSGDRAADLALRMKYALNSPNIKVIAEENLNKALQVSIEKTEKDHTVCVLPTYSAMLEIRQILTGRKIL